MQNNRNILSADLITLFGCGGHARSVADIAIKLTVRSLLFVDPNGRPGETIFGFPVVIECPNENKDCFIAIGDNKKRKILYETLKSHKYFHSIIASSVHIGSFSQVGKNVFIGNLAHIGPEASVGDNTIINTGAIIEHEVVIGPHCHIGPNAVISGKSKIGAETFVGVGAVIKDGVTIGSNITIGAGAVVVHDLLEPGVYVGCPARVKFPALSPSSHH